MRLAAGIFVAAIAAVPGHAQDAAIEGVISSQIEAFLHDDFATAFGFASPGIRSLFGTPERFGEMVRQGYPMVHRPADVTFLDLATGDGTARQRVLVRDRAGAYHTLEYEMVEGPEGWKIGGVRLLPSGALGA